jgi:hypothetical protein
MDIWFTLFVTFAGLFSAVGFSLVMIGYINSTLASFQYGWKNWLTVVLFPVLGGIFFCYKHKEDHLKAGYQLGAGTVCILISLAMLYGTGPLMVSYMAHKMQEEQISGDEFNRAAAIPPSKLESGSKHP